MVNKYLAFYNKATYFTYIPNGNSLCIQVYGYFLFDLYTRTIPKDF